MLVAPPMEQLLAGLVREAFGDGAQVSEVVPLAGDASTRRYLRLSLSRDDTQESPALRAAPFGKGGAHLRPVSAVAMLLADRGIAMSSDELAVFKEQPRELPYVNVHRFLERLGVAIPEIYLDASERGVLLLEDIGDTPLWDAVQHGDASLWYRRAIDQLLQIQIEGSKAADQHCIAFQQSFDERLFLWEFEHFLEYGVEKRLGRPIPAADVAQLRREFARIAARLGAAPQFLNHRDYHSWNLYVQGDRIRVIDFQDALLAPAPYDLATLLGDRDTPQVVTPALERELLDYYIAGWRERGGADIDRQEMEAQYFDCAFQKALKVVGRFHYLAMVKGKPGYMRYMPATVRRVLALLPRYPDLAEVLPRYLPDVA
ncbi:MAG TPA: phosphotransferase [Terriglobales bacterium]|nr:phosphotransferase [Terriglobales bacterium]